MLYSIVRLALDASVKCCLPFVNFQIKNVSTVPNNKSFEPRSFFEILTLSKIHLILVAEKYGSINNPVLFLNEFS